MHAARSWCTRLWPQTWNYLILFNTIIDFRIVSSWGCAQLVHEMVDADIKAIELNALEGTRRSSIM